MKPNPEISDRPSPMRPAGERKSAWLAILEQGANLLQTDAPLKGFDVYVVGFHCAKGDPRVQTEAHHFCRVVNDDLLQCVLFDGNTKDANLIGIEYVVSARMYDAMPEHEKPLWHPHNFAVLSGQLAAPGLPRATERAFLEQLLNSYGKTWHTWQTSATPGEPATSLPYGEPTLMWSFNREGECDASMKRDRDEAMGLDSDAQRADRQPLVGRARPQRGVDEMKDDFPGSVPIPGVVEAEDG